MIGSTIVVPACPWCQASNVGVYTANPGPSNQSPTVSLPTILSNECDWAEMCHWLA